MPTFSGTFVTPFGVVHVKISVKGFLLLLKDSFAFAFKSYWIEFIRKIGRTHQTQPLLLPKAVSLALEYKIKIPLA